MVWFWLVSSQRALLLRSSALPPSSSRPPRSLSDWLPFCIMATHVFLIDSFHFTAVINFYNSYHLPATYVDLFRWSALHFCDDLRMINHSMDVNYTSELYGYISLFCGCICKFQQALMCSVKLQSLSTSNLPSPGPTVTITFISISARNLNIVP